MGLCTGAFAGGCLSSLVVAAMLCPFYILRLLSLFVSMVQSDLWAYPYCFPQLFCFHVIFASEVVALCWVIWHFFTNVKAME